MDTSEGNRRSMITIRELFETSINFYKTHWKLFTGIQSIPAVLALLSLLFVRPQVNVSTGLAVLFSILGALATGFSWLAIMWAVKEKNTTVKDAYKKSLAYAVPGFVIGLLETLAVLAGFVLLIIPGIYLSIAFSLSHYVLFSEGLRSTTALKASKFYVKGYWWGVLGRYLLLGIAIFAVQFILGLLGGAGSDWEMFQKAIREGGEPQYKTPGFVDYISTLVSIFVFTPLSIIYGFNIYESLKALKGEYNPTS